MNVDRFKIKRIQLYDLIIWILMFLTPFCYPFRTYICKFVPLHVFIIMYLTLAGITFLLFFKVWTFYISKWMLALWTWYILFLPLSCDWDTGLKWIINLTFGILMSGMIVQVRWGLKKIMPYAFGTVICSCLLLPVVVNKLGFSENYMYTVRIPFMEGDISIGPNAWAQTISFAILITLIYIVEKKRKRVHLYILLAALFGFLYITQSRTQTYALVGVVALMLLRIISDRKQTLRNRLTAILLIIVAVLAVGRLVINGLFNAEQSRLLNIDFNGRNEIWNLIVYAFFNKMSVFQQLFGVGTGGASVFLASVDTMTKFAGADHLSPHNLYFDALLSSGLIGMILSIGYWIRAVIILIFKQRKSLYFVFPLFILISGMGSHLFINWEFSLYVAITEVAIYEYNKERGNLFLVTLGKGYRGANSECEQECIN